MSKRWTVSPELAKMRPMNERPVGKRFTDVYRERGERSADSKKFRKRLANKLDDLVGHEAASEIRAETGIEVYGSSSLSTWQEVLFRLQLDELLDFITVAIQAVLTSDQRQGVNLLLFVKRAMDEENLSFDLDNAGGVHYRVDEAFQGSRQAALGALEGADMTAALVAFEEAHQALNGHPANELTAVRRAFDAVENVFKMKFKTSRLGASEIKSELRDLGAPSSTRAKDAAARLNMSFAEWVNAAHQYRHAPGEADPSPPPRWLAIALVDGAATFIRYLTAS